MLLYLGDLHGFEWVFGLIFIVFLLWCWALVDILRSDFKDNATKVIWLIVVIFIPFPGIILYPIIGTNQKVKAPGNHY
jgi:hypothetical protein